MIITLGLACHHVSQLPLLEARATYLNVPVPHVMLVSLQC